ncbi:TYRO protein tyrosine kinase-binding protein [Bombina bombina]|uniref:TYRO protein tyrosine kinase-binding protein n=1 Tax=Bombina bombina TaxID=8345 RepID=UPI00235AF744|nr:TYRO protein tyrosine kinase-binding protein [Bombina bombina]XP_053552900.1 TYRO protein tyrosine kinase-binding protein [Bombina bombina]
MYRPHSEVTLMLLALYALGAVKGQDECGNCLHLDSGSVIGIVVCDVIITVLIAFVAYYVSLRMERKRHAETKKVNDLKEPTYEELQGQRTEVYNDLSRPYN